MTIDTAETSRAGLELVDPTASADDTRLHPALALLRAEDPVHWVDPLPAVNPFWAVTKHPDVLEIERQHELFRNVARHATADQRTGPIKQGDSPLLCYPSANRDEDVFDRPAVFDVGRSPNRHLAFGFGAHYCLGATLARMEIRAFFAELIPRLHAIALTGSPASVATTFVGGLKRLPIRYQLTERGA